MSYPQSLLDLVESLTKSGYPADLALQVAKKLDNAINPETKEGK